MPESEINAREVLSTLSLEAKDLAIYMTPFADIGGDIAAVMAISGIGDEGRVNRVFEELSSRGLAERGHLFVDHYEVRKGLEETSVPVYKFTPLKDGDRYRLDPSFKEAIIAQIPEDEDI